MAFRDFSQLDVYRLSEEIGDAVWTLAKSWDRFAADTLGAQTVRAADSIGANLAEGWGRNSWQERVRYAHIARGSLTELRHWLRCAHRRGLVGQEQVDTLKPLIEKIEPMLNAYISHLKRRAAEARGVKEQSADYEVFAADFKSDVASAPQSTSQRVNQSTVQPPHESTSQQVNESTF